MSRFIILTGGKTMQNVRVAVSVDRITNIYSSTFMDTNCAIQFDAGNELYVVETFDDVLRAVVGEEDG